MKRISKPEIKGSWLTVVTVLIRTVTNAMRRTVTKTVEETRPTPGQGREKTPISRLAEQRKRYRGRLQKRPRRINHLQPVGLFQHVE